MASTFPTTIRLSDLEGILAQSGFAEAVKSTGVMMQCPVRLGTKRDGSDLWTLSLEPLVSVKASKTVVRRNIAKAVGTGTVKEQWSQDDYEISISGLFQSSDVDKLPEADLSRLQALLTKGKSLVIRSALTDIIGIELFCVTAWEFPATAGVENQEYRFSGYSDEDFDLVI